MVEGLAKGTRLTLDEEMVIGRAESGEGRLGDDPELSRKHARVFREAGRVVVEDLGSANGTYVNAVRLSEPRILEPGDVVRMGRTTLELTGGERPRRSRPPPPARPPPPRRPRHRAPAPPIPVPPPAPTGPVARPAAPADALPARGRSSPGAASRRSSASATWGSCYRAEELALQRHVALKVIRPEHSERGSLPRALPPRVEGRRLDRPPERHPDPRRRRGGRGALHQRCGSSRAPTCVRCSPPRARWSRSAPRGSSARSGPRSTPPTRAAWCTATSSRPTCCSRAADHVYLSDFGLAKRADEAGGLTRQGSIVARAEYVAPEQILEDRVDALTDVYALGCLLFEAITGEAPYVGVAGGPRMLAHINEPPPSPLLAEPCLPRGFDDVVQRAMAKGPERALRLGGRPRGGGAGRRRRAAPGEPRVGRRLRARRRPLRPCPACRGARRRP